MKELAIGQIGVIDGVKVECCKAEYPFLDCHKCVFVYTEACANMYKLSPCGAGWRSDHTDVYFKRVEE